VAYVSPTITPSGTTFSLLLSGGFHGQLARLASANAMSADATRLIMGDLGILQTAVVNLVDSYIKGEPVANADVNAKLLTYATALKTLATAIDEINVLIDANPGTIRTFGGIGASCHSRRRTFP
jgi:hypothetical protein